MNEIEIKEKIKEMIAKLTETEVAENEINIHEELDSINVLLLVNEINSTFNVSFGNKPQDIDALRSLSDLAKWVKAHND